MKNKDEFFFPVYPDVLRAAIIFSNDKSKFQEFYCAVKRYYPKHPKCPFRMFAISNRFFDAIPDDCDCADCASCCCNLANEVVKKHGNIADRMNKNMLSFYNEVLPVIEYAKEHDLLRAGVRLSDLPKKYHQLLLKRNLWRLLDLDGIPLTMLCEPRRLHQTHPCANWSCEVCVLHALDSYIQHEMGKSDD